ncbi:MAG: type II toxin-antitoxin system prevent-host-death family antitoxin [Shinella sp.]|jgi:antitoxin (DNA-binding transcriptional repressor) of toxin-antitoxin stability system|nr:type II toxin-antitoxin system prevent-host-death family antitoxin [Shinella sp.]
MTITVGDADLIELLAKVEAGEEVILARENEPAAKISRIAEASDRRRAIKQILAFRATMPHVTKHEIAEWKKTGRR